MEIFTFINTYVLKKRKDLCNKEKNIIYTYSMADYIINYHRPVPKDFDKAFREVVRLRLALSLRKGGELFPESVELWHAVR